MKQWLLKERIDPYFKSNFRIQNPKFQLVRKLENYFNFLFPSTI